MPEPNSWDVPLPMTVPEPLTPLPPEPFEIHGELELKIPLKIDLAGLIVKYQAEYDAIDDEKLRADGYADWEKPVVFLWKMLAEDGEPDVFVRGHPYVQEMLWDPEFEVRPRWTREMAEQLAAHLAPRYPTVESAEQTVVAERKHNETERSHNG